MDIGIYLKSKVLQKLALQTKAQEVLGVVKDHWQETINSQIAPALKLKTIQAKTLRKFPEPDTPLKATGDLYNGLILGEVTDSSIRINYSSKVNPAWHRSDHRAKGVPKRDPLADRATLFGKIKKILQGG